MLRDATSTNRDLIRLCRPNRLLTIRLCEKAVHVSVVLNRSAINAVIEERRRLIGYTAATAGALTLRTHLPQIPGRYTLPGERALSTGHVRRQKR